MSADSYFKLIDIRHLKKDDPYLKEIGEVMEISESRVSQIHTKAVIKLRGMVRDKFAHSI